MQKPGTGYSTAPLLAAVPWLVHGFGRAGWDEADMRAAAELRGFRPVIMRQLHSDIIHRLDRAPTVKLEGDALMTDVPGILPVIRTADCLPVLLADPKRRAVAAVHAGWRGTQKRILEKTIRAMSEASGTAPGDLLAALGPCIGPACYEVGPEVREAFDRAGFPASVFTNSFLDLRAANIWLLEALGVKRANISTSDACTHCDPGLLSYRRHKGEPRRLYNFIGIRM